MPETSSVSLCGSTHSYILGFGRRVSWEDDKQIPPGHRLSFKGALHDVSTYITVKLLTPKWAYYFSKFLRRVQLSFDELEVRGRVFSFLSCCIADLALWLGIRSCTYKK